MSKTLLSFFIVFSFLNFQNYFAFSQQANEEYYQSFLNNLQKGDMETALYLFDNMDKNSPHYKKAKEQTKVLLGKSKFIKPELISKYSSEYKNVMSYANSGNYDQALSSFYYMNKSNPYYKEISKKVVVWKQLKAKKDADNKYYAPLSNAQSYANDRKYNQAIYYAQQISKNNPYYKQAQMKILEWKDAMLNNTNSSSNNSSSNSSKNDSLTDSDYCRIFTGAFFEKISLYKSHDKVKECHVDNVTDLGIDRWVYVKINAFVWVHGSFGGSMEIWRNYTMEVKKDGSSYRNLK